MQTIKKKELILCKKEERENERTTDCRDIENDLNTCLELLKYVQATYHKDD